jgi:uncharacterized protein (DUF1501 family)
MMNRRKFLKGMASSAALTAAGSTLTLSNAQAATASASDHFWVFVTASGGWDTTMLCDPKGNLENSRGTVNRFYSPSEIRTAGNLRYAPSLPGSEDFIDTFMQKHYQRLTVINGMDHGTLGHSVGRRVFKSGSDAPTMPILNAMVSCPYKDFQPMAMLINGKDNAGGLLAPSRITDTDLISYVNNANPYLPTGMMTDLESDNESRLQSLLNRFLGENKQKDLLNLRSARSSSGRIGALHDYLPGRCRSNSLQGQGSIAAAAFAAGLATSATMEQGGFDTHADNDIKQDNSLRSLLKGVDHLWSELERVGVAHKTTVVIGSDFGRSPFYPDGEGTGKTHWSVGSVMMMGKGIEGNRVIGGTTDDLQAKRYNPQTLQEDPNGIVLTPAHLHKSLRKLGGVHPALEETFPLNVEEVAFFA